MTSWPIGKRFAFRFFFIYIILTIAPWTWLGDIPGISKLIDLYFTGFEALSLKLNQWFFHVPRPTEPVQNNGSGDTSSQWAILFSTIFIAAIGAIIWSLIQRNKKEYNQLNYWLCLFTRYTLIITCFTYGIIKVFALQMPFPNYSQLATPLGDFLPMRLSWMFLGYSFPYQFFSGLMEIVAGTLLIFRRTATLGAMVAAGVFLNVAMLNLSYDIPVKIFSMQMTVLSLYLLANESNRLLSFFVYNRPAERSILYTFPLQKRSMRITRLILKSVFIIYFIGTMLYNALERQKGVVASMKNMPFKAGMYDVTKYAVGNDTVSLQKTDSLHWSNIIFDTNNSGSIATKDPAFRNRYSRAYFAYTVDTTKHTFNIFKRTGDSLAIANMHYQFLDENTIAFNGIRQKDSLFFILKRSSHTFQLAERQFHWISEANR